MFGFGSSKKWNRNAKKGGNILALDTNPELHFSHFAIPDSDSDLLKIGIVTPLLHSFSCG